MLRTMGCVQLSAYVVIALPVVVLIWTTITNYEYVSLLWTTLLGILMCVAGLVAMVIGHTLDDKLRAFDLRTGEILWDADLPFGGMATPVTYEIKGEQYVVLTAGGHSMYGSTPGDAVVAFKLKR